MALPKALGDLTTGELLAALEINPGPLLDWLVAALGVSGWWKGVEFAQPVNAPAANVDTPVQRALPHMIAGAGTPPSLLATPKRGRPDRKADAQQGRHGWRCPAS
jgi:hypothetical protein